MRSKIKLAILMLIFPLLVVPQISTAQTSASENRGTVKLVEFHWTSIPPEKEYIGSNEILEAHYRFVFQPWCEEGVLEDLIANITDIADMPTELNWKGVPPEEYAGDNWIAWEYGDISSGEETPLLEWDDLACRTKIAIKTNTKALIKNLDSKTFGVHRVVFYGDFREKFKDLATLIGFEVVEEDIEK